MCSLVSRQWNFPSSNICISPISHPTTNTQIFVSHPYPTTKIPKILLLLLSELRWWQKKDFQQKHYFEKTYQRAFEGTIKANFYDLIWAPHASVGHQPVWPNVYQFFPTFKNTQFSSLSKLVSSTHPLSNEAENLSGSKLALRKIGVISFTTRQFSSQNRLRVSYSLNLAKPNLVTPTVHLKTKTKCLNGQTSNFQNTPF